MTRTLFVQVYKAARKLQDMPGDVTSSTSILTAQGIKVTIRPKSSDSSATLTARSLSTASILTAIQTAINAGTAVLSNPETALSSISVLYREGECLNTVCEIGEAVRSLLSYWPTFSKLSSHWQENLEADERICLRVIWWSFNLQQKVVVCYMGVYFAYHSVGRALILHFKPGTVWNLNIKALSNFQSNVESATLESAM